MIQPGLHELECNQCGAPINPPAESTVVRCTHCGQPHMWIAPASGAPGRWAAEPAKNRGSASGRLPLLAGGGLVVVVLLLVVAGAAGVWAVGRRDVKLATVAADAPLEIGDQLEWYRTPNDSCQSMVAGLLAGGRVSIECGDALASADRSQLVFESYAFSVPEADDVALESGGAGWSRVVVLGSDSGKRARVEPLLGGPEHSVDLDALHRVRPRNGSGPTWIPVPAGVPLAAGDVVNYRDGTVIATGKIDKTSASDVELVPGSLNSGVFTPNANAVPTRRARSTLVAQLASAFSPPPPTRVVLAPKGASFVRAHLVSTAEHGRWTVAADGSASFVVWGGNVLLLPSN